MKYLQKAFSFCKTAIVGEILMSETLMDWSINSGHQKNTLCITLTQLWSDLPGSTCRTVSRLCVHSTLDDCDFSHIAFILWYLTIWALVSQCFNPLMLILCMTFGLLILIPKSFCQPLTLKGPWPCIPIGRVTSLEQWNRVSRSGTSLDQNCWDHTVSSQQ